jgi:hypothetical protein
MWRSSTAQSRQGTETAQSDVDIMIVSDSVALDEIIDAVTGVQEQIGREINPSVYRTAELNRKLAAGHHFLSSVLQQQKIFLVGTRI